MAETEFIKAQITKLEDAFQHKNGFSIEQVNLLKQELTQQHIHNQDLEYAIINLIKQKRGRQPLPSIEEIMELTEKQREFRLKNQVEETTQQPFGNIINPAAVNNPILKLHARCLLRKFREKLKTPNTKNSKEAKIFRNIVKQEIQLLEREILNEGNVKNTWSKQQLQDTERKIIIQETEKIFEQYDPFYEPESDTSQE